MESIVDWRGELRVLLPGEFWHLTPPRGLIQHNAGVGKGVVSSVSVIARMPGLEAAVTPYSVSRRQDEKEVVWEVVRAQSFGQRPSRMKSLYCFDSKQLAESALRAWFPNEAREILRLRIIAGANIARCDAAWLDGYPVDWQQRARSYWSGDITDEPFVEVIVDGYVYFPDWERFPFAL
jgi:hypothetical protein